MDGSRSLQARLALLGFTGLFAFRVAAQFVESVSPSTLMPDFDRWSSGAIGYQLLLPLQLVILAAMIAGICLLPRLRLKQALLEALKYFAILYFAIMLVRLVIALTGISSLPWFQLPLPAFFHLVLASYLFCGARYISHNQSSEGGTTCTR